MILFVHVYRQNNRIIGRLGLEHPQFRAFSNIMRCAGSVLEPLFVSVNLQLRSLFKGCVALEAFLCTVTTTLSISISSRKVCKSDVLLFRFALTAPFVSKLS